MCKMWPWRESMQVLKIHTMGGLNTKGNWWNWSKHISSKAQNLTGFCLPSLTSTNSREITTLTNYKPKNTYAPMLWISREWLISTCNTCNEESWKHITRSQVFFSNFFLEWIMLFIKRQTTNHWTSMNHHWRVIASFFFFILDIQP